MTFSIKDFYSQISKRLLDNAINLHDSTYKGKEKKQILSNTHKITAVQQGKSVAKEKHQLL